MKVRLSVLLVIVLSVGLSNLPNANAQSEHPSVAVLQDDGAVVVPANAFDLANKSLVFTPQAGGYSVQSVTPTFDQGAGKYATAPLGDDDSVQFTMPFNFPFYGVSYNSIFVNSDGNLTFVAPDAADTNRWLNRMVQGPPRIAGFFDDFIPGAVGGNGFIGVETFSDRVNFYYIGVLEYPTGALANFEIILLKTGVIKINYSGTNAVNAVVGISPGIASSPLQVLDLSQQTSPVSITGTVAEVFSAQQYLDIQAASQHFYRSHPDSFDALMMFTDFDLAQQGSVATSFVLRNKIQGILVPQYPNFDVGASYGSNDRLSILVNGQTLSQYPDDPNAIFSNGQSAITLLAQQFGHRWMSYFDITPAGMLRTNNSSNWSFLMNSYGSVMDGNEIEDHGDGTFSTIGAKYRFSPLDQYLMGLRSADDVPPWFAVSNPTLTNAPSDFACTPLGPNCPATTGVDFSGTRRDITLQNVVSAIGPRIPAFADAQKDFSVAFVLITPRGTAPNPNSLAHLDNIRKAWATFFPAAVDNRGTMSTDVPATALSLQLAASGSVHTETNTGGATTQVGYGAITPGTGVAVLRSFSGVDLVSEAAVPATSAATQWIMYAEKTSGLSTGVAIANPGTTAANISLTLSDGSKASLQIPAGGQHAAFVDELFGTLPAPFLGTLTVQSNVPVAVLALRGTLNAKGQFIIATIPLTSTTPDLGGFATFPIVTDGGGYNTELIVVNGASTATTGLIGFSFKVETDLGTSDQFTFNIPAGGVWRLRTKGTPTAVAAGYASISVAAGIPMPSSTAIIRLSSNTADLISETAVPAQNQFTRGLMFGSRETNVRTGIAILNPNGQSVTLRLTPLDGAGNPVGAAGTLLLSPYSQKSAFLDEFISTLPLGFEGSVLLESPAPVFAISLRGTTDTHNGFLMSTLPVLDLDQSYAGPHYFPQVVDGGGFTTEFLMMNAGSSAIQLNFFNSAGQPMAVKFR